MAEMDKSRVDGRLRQALVAGQSGSYRDIAWAMIHEPNLLEVLRIKPLSDKRWTKVKHVYASSGGFDAPKLPHLESRVDKYLDYDREIEAENERAAEAATAVRPNKCRRLIGTDEVVFTPNQRLKDLYGEFNVREETTRATKQSADISDNQIPVGTFRSDQAPARLVTATIDVEDQKLHYTVQPLDKTFTNIPDHELYEPATGEAWVSTENIEQDSNNITFAESLHQKTYEEIVSFVFKEQRRCLALDTHWLSAQDMLEHPYLERLARDMEAFTKSDTAHAVSGSDQHDICVDILRKYSQHLDDLANEARNAARSGTHADAQRANRLLIHIWKKFGETFELMLLRRSLERHNG